MNHSYACRINPCNGFKEGTILVCPGSTPRGIWQLETGPWVLASCQVPWNPCSGFVEDENVKKVKGQMTGKWTTSDILILLYNISTF